MKQWLKASNEKQQRELARRSRTSSKYLHQLAGGHRAASADLASRLERAAALMRIVNPRLPLLPRERLATACGSCEFVKRCR